MKTKPSAEHTRRLPKASGLTLVTRDAEDVESEVVEAADPIARFPLLLLDAAGEEPSGQVPLFVVKLLLAVAKTLLTPMQVPDESSAATDTYAGSWLVTFRAVSKPPRTAVVS